MVLLGRVWVAGLLAKSNESSVALETGRESCCAVPVPLGIMAAFFSGGV